MTSDPSDYHREYSSYGSYSLFQFEGSDVISVLKNSIEYSFVFFKCLLLVEKQCIWSASIYTLLASQHKLFIIHAVFSHVMAKLCHRSHIQYSFN